MTEREELISEIAKRISVKFNIDFNTVARSVQASFPEETKREELAARITAHIFDERKRCGSWCWDSVKNVVLEALSKHFDIDHLYNPLPALYKELADELALLDDPNYVPSILKKAIETLKLQNVNEIRQTRLNVSMERDLLAKEITERINTLFEIDRNIVEEIIASSLPECFDIKIDDLEIPLHDLFRYLRNELMPLSHPRSMTLILQEAIINVQHSNEVRKLPYTVGDMDSSIAGDRLLMQDYIDQLLRDAHQYYTGGIK